MMKFVVCLVALAVAASAYNFEDSDFNQYLFDEFQGDYYDSLDDLSRNRREAEVASSDTKECGQRKKEVHCCSGDKIDLEQLKSYEELKKQCFIEIHGNEGDVTFDPFDCEKMQQVKQQMACVSECIYKKWGSFDEKGELKRDTLLGQQLKQINETPWKKDVVEAYVDKCIAEVKQKQAQGASKEVKGCNSNGLHFYQCMWREFVKGCPADLRVNTPKCNKLYERLAKGDNSILNKHFLQQYEHIRKSAE